MLWAASSGREEGLPAGYAPIEYLSTSNTRKEYIDTGISGDTNTKIELQAAGVTYTSFGVYSFFGAIDSGGNRFSILTRNNSFHADFGDNGKNLNLTLAVGEVYTLVKDGLDNYINGVPYASNPAKPSSRSLSVWLSAIHSEGGNYSFTGLRIYDCKIWKQGELLRDFIPVSNGREEALYDRVSGTLFPKQTLASS